MKNRRINYVIALLCKEQEESIRCNTGVRDHHGTCRDARSKLQFRRRYDVKEALWMFFFPFFFVPRRSAYNADLSRGTATRSGRSIVVTRYWIYVPATLLKLVFFSGARRDKIEVSSLTDDEYEFLQNIRTSQLLSILRQGVLHKDFKNNPICVNVERCNYRFVKKQPPMKARAHTQFWLTVIHVRSWSIRRNRASSLSLSLRAPSQVHLETDSVKNRRVSSLMMSKDLRQTFAVGAVATTQRISFFFFFSFLGTRVELGKRISDRVSESS